MGRYSAAEKLGSNVRVSDVLKLLDMRKGLNFYVQCKFVVDTLNRYMSSADELITTAHVPDVMMHHKTGKIVSVDHADKMVNH